MQRKKSFKRYVTTALAAVGFFAVTASAHALSLRVIDGSTTIATVDDGGAGDINPLAGAVTYFGTFGAATMNINTGSSKPLIGSAGAPEMHLDGYLVSNSPISLTLMLSDTGFTGSIGDFFAQLGGAFSNASSNITYSIYRDLSDTLFGTDPASLVCSIGPLTLSPFAGTCGNTLNLASPYSITLVATLNHDEGEGNNSSFNALVRDDARVPEPAAIILIGLGLIAVAKISRRKEVQATL